MYGRLLHLWIMDKNVSLVTVLFRRIKKLVMVNYQKMDDIHREVSSSPDGKKKPSRIGIPE